MRILDLFCGAGGCSMGYRRAGFEVVGVDIKHKKNYPFDFIQQDAMALLEVGVFNGFDAIHASPPCQHYSVLRHATPTRGKEAPDLIIPVRRALKRIGLPYVIENVPGAPMHRPLGLCGSMFGLGSQGRYLQRHRLFECSFPVEPPCECQHEGEAVGVYGRGGAWGGKYTFGAGRGRYPWERRGGYQGNKAEKAEAMDIDWMNDTELAQAIPPAYTEWIGQFLLEHLGVAGRRDQA